MHNILTQYSFNKKICCYYYLVTVLLLFSNSLVLKWGRKVEAQQKLDVKKVKMNKYKLIFLPFNYVNQQNISCK